MNLMKKPLKSNILGFIALAILLIGSYVVFLLVRTGLEIKYNIREIPTNISLEILDFIVNILRACAISLVAFFGYKYFKKKPSELNWIALAILLPITFFMLVTCFNFEIDPIVYYERLNYFNVLSYVGFVSLLAITSLLLLRERSFVAKFFGSIFMLFVVWLLL